MRRDLEEWLEMFRKIDSGRGMKSVSIEHRTDYVLLRQKYYRYKKYGTSGLEYMKGKRFSASEKEAIVLSFTDKGVPLSVLSLTHDVSITSLRRWIQTVRTGGSLYEIKKRGRRPKETMGRPKKKAPETELEKLKAENLYLKAENALLKKLKALVEKEKARGNGRESSNH